ncbi:MAG: translation elongation factor Ts [Fusobacteriota bacterium]
MAVTAKLIKELRGKTGAGMLNCKKALVETDGNIDEAMEYLRKKGIASADKKSGRVAAEGIILDAVSEDKKKGVILEFNSETDFVAKEKSFTEFVQKVADHILENDFETVEELEASEMGDKTVELQVKELIAKIGENLNIRRFKKVEAEDGFVSTYIHLGGKIGVIMETKGEVTDDNEVVAKDVAMHVAAMSPKFLDKDNVDPKEVEKEKELYKEEMRNSGKPEHILDKIVEGKMKKYYSENCLLEQEFVKDSDLTVSEYIDGKVDIINYTKFTLGEGIEKKEENFADEVKKQIG